MPDLIHDREQLVQAIQSGEEQQAVALLRSHLASLQPLGRHNDVLYYPIIPGHETESWRLLLQEAADRFHACT